MKIKNIGNYNYPERVISFTLSLIDTLEEDKFFEEEEIDPTIFFETHCEKVLGNWLSGLDLPLTQEEMLDVIANSAAQTALESLKAKGMLDSIKDENGEERFFLTTNGKEVANMILEKERDNSDK